MYFRGPLVGVIFCCFYLASYFTNKKRWQTLVGGLILHVCWKAGWLEINCGSRSEVLSWLPGCAIFVGIIYAGSRALTRLVCRS
ncbi:hypothetical protein GDO86_011110 [Hymenochirus boettgeri]|uniref:Uncharacterized protein n=1 Tax=Hymenochirus boettgeri TaxID=247094 RepID=A0A8T2JFA2_9PIPI|nr:hypothetical protein GDO86_011110 [Hymenochirus boettgeri]